MTLTAPVPVVNLASLVRAGLPISATARVQDTVPEGCAAVRAAIERNLQPLGITLDAGGIRYLLERDGHGWQVVGTWHAR